jgi:hypothetical protein
MRKATIAEVNLQKDGKKAFICITFARRFRKPSSESLLRN